MTANMLEAMYGTKESFEYRVCLPCGAYQIATVPGDLSRYNATAWIRLFPAISMNAE